MQVLEVIVAASLGFSALGGRRERKPPHHFGSEALLTGCFSKRSFLCGGGKLAQHDASSPDTLTPRPPREKRIKV